MENISPSLIFTGMARYVVVATLDNRAQLTIGPQGHINTVPIMYGAMRDDG
jgi:hypothetical protein